MTDLATRSSSVDRSNLLASTDLHLVNSMEQAQKFFRWLSEDRGRTKLAIDTETSSTYHEKAVLRLVQFGDLHSGWAIPWDQWGGVAAEAFDKYTGPLVGHNMAFEASRITLSRGQSINAWPWDRCDDTMFMAHCLDPSRSKALKSLSATLVDRQAAAGQDALTRYMAESGYTWETIPVDNPYYWGYGAMDCVLTAHVDDILAPDVANRCPVPYELELAVSRICTAMERKGTLVDLDYCNSKSAELRQYAAEMREWCSKNWPIKNPTSTQQLVKLFQDEGIPLSKITQGGKPSVDKEVLELLDHPIADAVIKIRRAEKLCSGYLDKFIHLADDDARVHATIWTCGTRTARMSISDPAWQTLHKQDKTVRNAVVHPQNYSLITCDADQIEMRLMAYFANDQGLTEAFNSDADFFCTLASTLFMEDIGKDDPRRKMLKSSMYARNYGAGSAKIAKTAGVPVQAINDLQKMLEAEYPGIPRFTKRIAGHVRETKKATGRGYVTSHGGRYMPVDENKDYVGINYLIQSTAAEVLKRAIVDLDSVGFGGNMLLPVHDEVIFEVPNEDAEEARRLIEKTMTTSSEGMFSLPITWSAETLSGAWGGREL